MNLREQAEKILELSKKTTEAGWDWSGIQIDSTLALSEPGELRTFIWVPQGSYLGDTMITLGDTYEGSGEDCLFVSESMKVIVELAKYYLENEKKPDEAK